MPLKQSEAIVLRTYPLREADLLVTLFTRAEGKVRGVAKSAKRSRKRFGGALEPLTCVRAHWQDREGSDLARLESCDVLLSPLSAPLDYPRLVALAHVAEMLDELLPDREPNDSIFRLAWSVLQALELPTPAAGGEVSPANAPAAGSVALPAKAPTAPIWLPLAYFDLWMLRLLGYLPPLNECIECASAPAAGSAAIPRAPAAGSAAIPRAPAAGSAAIPRAPAAGSAAIPVSAPAYFHALRDGLVCRDHRHIASSEMSSESRALAARIFRNPVERIASEPCPVNRLADLRKFLMQIIHRHLDRKLQTAAQLDRLD